MRRKMRRSSRSGLRIMNVGGSPLMVPATNCLGLSLRFSDFSDDGMDDLLVGRADGTVWLYENEASVSNGWNFSGGEQIWNGSDAVPLSPRAMVEVSDLDQNGLSEILLGGMDGRVRLLNYDPLSNLCSAVYLNDERGLPLELPTGRSAPSVADLSGDGVFEMMLGGSDGVLRVAFANQHPIQTMNRTFLPLLHAQSVGERSRPVAVDYNQDGVCDILAGVSNGTVVLLQGLLPENRAESFVFVQNDVDQDGLLDTWEQQIIDHNETDAISTIFEVLPDDDYDSDGLSNLEEFQFGTDPCNPDTDGDGFQDGIEKNSFGTNPLLADSDGDGLSDFDEIVLHRTDPLRADTDNDGWLDGEDANPRRFTDGSDDGDQMPNQWEYAHFVTVHYTDDEDYDQDGFSNLSEYISGTDPVEKTSFFCVNPLRTEPNGMVIQWNPITNRYYSILRSTNLMHGFQALETQLEHPQNSYTDRVDEVQLKSFYRVDVELKD